MAFKFYFLNANVEPGMKRINFEKTLTQMICIANQMEIL
jgi:hypothetical protein